MTTVNKKVYDLIKGKVSSRHLENILGGSLHRGLVNYQKYLGDTQFDLAELLLKSLGNRALFIKNFQEFLIYNVLTDVLIEEIAKSLKVSFTNSFSARKEVSTKSKSKIGKTLIRVLDLDENEFNESDESVSKIETEILAIPDQAKFLSLHDYQKRIKDEIVKNLLENTQARMLVHMPTGSGKTKTCVEAIVDFVRTRPFNEGIVIWFAHSNELCSQAYDSLLKIWESKGDYQLPIFRIFGEHDPVKDILEYKKAIVFIGFQKFHSLLKSQKEESVKIRTHLSTNAQLVIIDEAHKSLAETYKHAIDYVSPMPNCRIVGLTATPGRSNNMYDPANTILSDFFGDKLITIKNDAGVKIKNPLIYLQDKSVLAYIDHKPITIDLNDFTESELLTIIANRELDKDQIEKIVESPVRNKVIIDEIDKALKDEEKDIILVFACNANHCVLIQKLLEFQGIKSEIVLATTPNKLREKYITDFKNGNLKVLINFGVLTTGFDAPKLKTLIIARHTNSMILYSQMIGRALRGPLNGGNEKNYIIDLVDNISNLGSPDFLFTYWEDFWGRKYNTRN